MVPGGLGTTNGSCTTRVNSCVRSELYTETSYTFLTRLQGNIVVARELARRHGDKMVSTSLHPGSISRTGITRRLPWWLRTLLVRFIHHGGKYLTPAGGLRIG